MISEGKYANCIISLYFVLWENTIIIFNFCQMLIILWLNIIFYWINWWCMSEWAGLGTSKIFIVPTVQVPHEMQKISWKNFLSCLVSEIQLFVYIFGQNSKWRPEVRKGSHEYYNLTKFRQNRIKNKNFLFASIVWGKSKDCFVLLSSSSSVRGFFEIIDFMFFKV